MIFARDLASFTDLKFTLDHTDGAARAGTLSTGHGDVPTPMFMPVGTQGTVKAIEPRELREIGARIILGNTYHLYLRPGTEIIEKAGGLHAFAAWDRPILTDSGGYQVFSLADLRGIDPDGVVFRSHHDGSTHRFTPESVIDIQRSLGSDIAMVLDECVAYPCDESSARRSHELTVRWADRCRGGWEKTTPRYGVSQSLFGIVQGSTYPQLREESASALTAMNFEGYAIGGLSVGEPVEEMYAITSLCTGILPAGKPRYLMGVGTPENVLESIERGIDLFDCVMPTRNARNALLFTRDGKLNIRNAACAADFSPPDAECECYTCQHFSRSYLRHLIKAGEILGLQLATLHNLAFYLWLVGAARDAIMEGKYRTWKGKILERMSRNSLNDNRQPGAAATESL